MGWAEIWRGWCWRRATRACRSAFDLPGRSPKTSRVKTDAAPIDATCSRPNLTMLATMPSASNLDISAVSMMVGRSSLAELADRGTSTRLVALAHAAGLLDSIPGSHITPSNLLTVALYFLRGPGARYAYAYRAAIFDKVLLGRHTLRTATAVTELRTGDRKADVVLFNGTSRAYEIKTERDDLSRLPAQLAAFRRVFAEVVVLCDERLADDVLKLAPCDVGVEVLQRGRGSIRSIRRPTPDVNRFEPLLALDSMTRSEAVAVLAMVNRPVPSVPNGRMYAVLREAFSTLPQADTHSAFVDVMKRSRSALAAAPHLEHIPSGLAGAVLPLQLNRAQWGRFLAALHQPVLRQPSATGRDREHASPLLPVLSG